jgi:hypothetical protein|nr:MAG TPA: hypothetical protein [Caudoviricetes sp.]
MEGITLFVSIVIIVFGILQIILFFKLWGMTNDVKKIRKTISPNKSEDSININETSVTPSDIEIIDNFGSITKQKPTM